MEEGKEYKRHGFWMEEMENVGVTILREVISIFNTIGLTYFIDYGTLLGCIRDQKLIAIDRDIDFGIYAEDYTSEIMEELYKIPNTFRHKIKTVGAHKKKEVYYIANSENELISRLGFVKKSFPRVACDIYLHYLGYDISNGNVDRIMLATGKTVPKHYLDEFTTTEFYGMDVSIPKNTEAYLNILYKKNWRKPLEVTHPWKYFKGVLSPREKRKKGENK